MTQDVADRQDVRTGVGQRGIGWWVFGAGAVGAVAIPGWRVGIGWPVTAAAVVVVAVAAYRARVAGDRASGASASDAAAVADGATLVNWSWRIAAGLAAALLAAVPAVRAAGWLAALCLLAALPLASYALAGTGAGVSALVALPNAVPRGVAWAAAGVSTPDGRSARLRAFVAVLVGVVLVLIFGALFRAADRRFEDLVDGWLGSVSPGTAARFVVGFVLVAALAAGAAFVVHNGERDDGAALAREDRPARRPLAVAEWGAPVAMLVALFATFVWTQLGTLFGGLPYVMDPEGPDFADYARTGFLLLAGVTVLTLVVVAVVARLADRTLRRDRILLRVLGGALCGLTLVIVASALDRMNLYVDAYGFSGQRLLGYAVEVWLGLLFVLVIVAGWRLRAGWLPRAAVAASVAVLLGVVAVNPDALMARTHANRLDKGYPLDTAFLASLSADAAGELATLPPELRACLLGSLARDVPRVGDPWYRWNAGREKARRVFAGEPDYPASCAR
jgi:hypothetical protein